MDFFNAKAILQKQRWVWIDSDKGISILLVGYGHCYSLLKGHGLALSSYPFFNFIGIFLYGFRMPLFFIISGIFIFSGLKRKGLSGYIENRFNTILYPLLVWGTIQITFGMLTSGITHKAYSYWSYLDLILQPRRMGHFWYLNTLFCIGVTYAFTRMKLKIKPVLQLVIGLVLYLLSAYIHIHELNAFFLTDIFEFYFFFALGDVVSNHVLNEKNFKILSSWKVFSPLWLAFFYLQYQFTQINLHGGKDDIMFVEHKMPFFFLLEALVGCTISINFSFLLQKYNALRFLRIIGFHSLYIYSMQMIVMTIARVILLNVIHVTSVPVLILTIWTLGTIVPMIFYNICIKIKFWWLFTFRPVELKAPSAPKVEAAQSEQLITKSWWLR